MWVSEKMNSFGGMKKLWIFLGDHYIIGLICWGGGGVFLYILGLFLKARYRMGIFFAVTTFQIFIWECLICVIFLMGKQ